jgi:branched-chain amino acid transport system ATP-binding protein
VALLQVTKLRAGYGRTEVLHGVDLVVPPASTVVLLGPNGAGKTTLLHTIAGLVPVRSGDLTFQGTSIVRTPAYRRVRKGICLIPEGRGVFRHLTVRENLLAAAGSEHAATAVEQAVSIFPALRDRLRQEAGILSGGQQQMLALARAFLSQAPLILCDEPSIGLAPVIIDELFEAIGTLRREGRSLILVEQFVERAVGLADYVYILSKGVVVFVGEPAECDSGTVFARYLGAAHA